MDPLSMMRIAQGGVSIANTLFGGGSDPARNNRRQTIKLLRERGDAIREGAERSGFNPLTYLGASSGAQVGGSVASTPPLASFAATLGQIADGMQESRLNALEEERLRQSAEAQYRRVEADQIRAGGVGGVKQATQAQQVIDMGGTNNEGLGLRPVARGLWSQGAMPVVRGDGTFNQIPAKLGERLGMEPWDVWTMGDNEEIYGDETGQVVGLPRVPGTIQQVEGGMPGYDLEERQERMNNRWGFGSLGIDNWSFFKPAMDTSEPMTRGSNRDHR